MVEIPAGSFMMGCSESDSDCDYCDYDEYPYHEVTLSAYSIDKYEVTVGDYQKCVDTGNCNNENENEPQYTTNTDDSDCNLGASGKDNHPMNCVSWYGAKAYCEWVGKRLPTEAEWEKAARGTNGSTYPWGYYLATCDYAVMFDSYTDGEGCRTGGTWEVGSKPKGISPFGAYDMAGNVWEWCSDWYDNDYYETSSAENPTGPETGIYRISRGGSWNAGDSHYSYRYMRASIRYGILPDFLINDQGFRCAK